MVNCSVQSMQGGREDFENVNVHMVQQLFNSHVSPAQFPSQTSSHSPSISKNLRGHAFCVNTFLISDMLRCCSVTFTLEKDRGNIEAGVAMGGIAEGRSKSLTAARCIEEELMTTCSIVKRGTGYRRHYLTSRPHAARTERRS